MPDEDIPSSAISAAVLTLCLPADLILVDWASLHVYVCLFTVSLLYVLHLCCINVCCFIYLMLLCYLLEQVQCLCVYTFKA